MGNEWMGWVATGLCTIFGWLWNQDRKNQNERMVENMGRVQNIERRLNSHEADRIGREEFNGVAASLRKEFHAEHANIIKTMNDNNIAIRAEMRDNNKEITLRFDRLIERISEK